MEQVKFQGIVICAHCVSAIFQSYEHHVRLRIRSSDDELFADNLHPAEVLRAIREGRTVEDAATFASYGPAVTTIAGTAVCGWHAYAEMRTRR